MGKWLTYAVYDRVGVRKVLKNPLFALFFVSGFCGLIYESLWSHYLKLFLGHAAYAQTVVLIVFIGGMAIGAWVCGRVAPRIRYPLLAYAAAELIIGICAIAFHPVYVGVTEWAYSTLLPATCGAEDWCVTSWLVAALLILPQSILLGTTFPLMTGGILRVFPGEPGRRIGLLYFLNSFGAVFGVLTSAFVLIPNIGLPNTSVLVGILNLVLGLCVVLIALRVEIPRVGLFQEVPSQSAPSRDAASTDIDGSISTRLLLWVALLTGLSSFIYEVVWIRMLSLVLGSSTHAFELMLASFILGIALGGWWIRGRIDGLRDPRRYLAVVQVLMGLFAIATIGLYNASFDFMAWMLTALSRSVSGYQLFNLGGALISMSVMLAPTFMAGMTLPLLTFLLMRSSMGERSIGYVYAWNTFGSIAGVIIAVHFALPQLGLKYSLVVAGLIDVLLGIVLIWPAAKASRNWRRAAMASLLLAVVAGALLQIDPMRTASGVFRGGLANLPQKNELLFHRDGKTASVDVVRAADGRIFIQSNGKPDASYQPLPNARPTIDEATQVLIAAVGLAHRPQAEEVAIIGFGSGISTAAMLGSPAIKRVDTIEIEPAMVEGARHFRPANEAAYADPRSKIVQEDAKSYFARGGQRYDIIVSEPSNPWVSGVSSLFTREFYARLRLSLKPGGLLVQWIHAYEFNATLLASIFAALGGEFGDYVVYVHGYDLMVVATMGSSLPPLSEQIFQMPDLRGMLNRHAVRAKPDLQAHRLAGRSSLERLLPVKSVPVNSDYAPYVDTHAAQARFLTSTVGLIGDVDLYPIPLVELFEPVANSATVTMSTPKFSVGSVERGEGKLVAHNAVLNLLREKQAFRRLEASNARADRLLTSTRLLLDECASATTYAELWDDMVSLAAIVNPALDATRAQSFWRDMAASACLARASAAYRTWMALFAAVGARDAQRMTQLGAELLEAGGLTPNQRAYALLASLAGSLSRKDAAGTKRVADYLLQLTPAQQRSPGFLGLRALSGL
ncbi:MAG: fused MFS/spermidine synthase [Burkholderiales bacterium]